MHGNTTHGYTSGGKKHPLYLRWRAMMTRCYNSSWHGYAWYGGKGIKVAKEWHSFEGFLSDMGSAFFEGAVLDRRDSSKDYCKENCRWITKRENAKRASNHFTAEQLSAMAGMLAEGKTQTEVAAAFGVRQGTISNAMKRWRLYGPEAGRLDSGVH